MDEDYGELTVFFQEPFWVGVFQRVRGGELAVCRVTFGAEPRDAEVWELVLKHYDQLRFSPAVAAEKPKTAANPKRRQREAERQLQRGIGTRAQQALQLQREASRLARQSDSRMQKEAEKQRRFAQKQQKRKEKHRGR